MGKKNLTEEKIKVYEKSILGDHVLLHLDSTKEGVEVPTHLKNNPALTLKVSQIFQGHLEHDKNRILTHLKFNNEYFCCIIPWEAIWSITDDKQKNTIWHEDIPKILVINSLKTKLKSLSSKIIPSKKKKEKKTQEEEEKKTLREKHLKKRRSSFKVIK